MECVLLCKFSVIFFFFFTQKIFRNFQISIQKMQLKLSWQWHSWKFPKVLKIISSWLKCHFSGNIWLEWFWSSCGLWFLNFCIMVKYNYCYFKHETRLCELRPSVELHGLFLGYSNLLEWLSVYTLKVYRSKEFLYSKRLYLLKFPGYVMCRNVFICHLLVFAWNKGYILIFRIS